MLEVLSSSVALYIARKKLWVIDSNILDKILDYFKTFYWDNENWLQNKRLFSIPNGGKILEPMGTVCYKISGLSLGFHLLGSILGCSRINM